MTSAATARQQYARDAILSASPARLLTMLYDRLLLDLRRAETAQQSGDWQAASHQLLHAQDIVIELSATLRPDVWDGADGLQGLYEYVRLTLIDANVKRDVARTREAMTLVEPLHEAWHAAASALADAAAATAVTAASFAASSAASTLSGAAGSTGTVHVG